MELAISINPTYKCNLNCNFCYLKELHNDCLMNLNILNEQLKYISQFHKIKYIDLFGGEITLLDEQYIFKLIQICEYYTKNISLMSNFIKLPKWIYKLNYPIGTSWDYKFRQGNEIILNNIDNFYLKTNKKIPILLCSPQIYNYKDEVLKSLDRDSIESFSLIPCMKTKFNNIQYNWKAYEETIKYFISHKIKPKFINEYKLKEKREIYKHIFINPNNEFVDVAYDENGCEYFKKIDINNLKLEIPQKCLTCKYFDKCQNEHIENYLEDDYDCIGFYKLINWYNERRT